MNESASDSILQYNTNKANETLALYIKISFKADDLKLFQPQQRALKQ